jgi:lysophospholipase L1-like esterase
MRLNPTAATVVCFGDSNTYGAPADDENYVRLGVDERWTGRLQRILGDAYAVVEEGLNGRTTDVEYADRTGCNGRPYFAPCLRTHHPIDIVVIMLGTNDLKTEFDRSPAEIAAALDGYLDDVASQCSTPTGEVPHAILVSPILIDDTAPAYEVMTASSFDPTSIAKSRELAAHIRRVVDRRVVYRGMADGNGIGRVEFLDAATVARAGADGLHLTRDSHESLALLIAAHITAVGNLPLAADEARSALDTPGG